MFINSIVPVFLGDCLLDDEDEVAEYLSVVTGYSYEEIINADELFIKRLNARLLTLNFKERIHVATQSLLTAIADKKRAGKKSKPFSVEELLEFQGINRTDFVATKKLYEQLTTDVTEEKQLKQQKIKKTEKKNTVKASLRERLVKWRGLDKRI
ncbi:hypothetical protein IW492_05915 [Enterococcus sp. BWB1-3]|uniref:hypothetical protein n=1 Tax=Enterococcus sp. BWB1-3 TaxID=2787713 RepID=UPI0019228541|nr:hypothetical protein [Enterococcus sp. BWB1-3]MBL1228768.1 hypothetical protein [Enterococcus sp. BWB1-3]